jgi:hypothetical protein
LEEGHFITVRAEGLTLNYNRELYWSEEQFNAGYKQYSADKAGHLGGFADHFAEGLFEYGLHATGYRIAFILKYELASDQITYSTLIQAKVHDAISVGDDYYYAEFEWLLEPLGLNLYDLKQITDRTLVLMEGAKLIDHIPTMITLELPSPIIGHCYYHVWYKRYEI